jgi:hypothetical protein
LSERAAREGSAAFAAFGFGARMAGRALASRAAVIALVTAVLAAVTLGAVERRRSPLEAADRLLTVVAELVVPLLVLALVRRAVAGRLEDALWPAARFGLPRRHVALGVTLATTALALGATLCVVWFGLGAAYGLGTGLFGDAVTTSGVMCLGAAAYTAWFLVGASFGRRGGGVVVVLVLDFTLGAGEGALAAPWPRPHLRNLLGGTPLLGASPREASIVLLGLAVILGLGACLRASDRWR